MQKSKPRDRNVSTVSAFGFDIRRLQGAFRLDGKRVFHHGNKVPQGSEAENRRAVKANKAGRQNTIPKQQRRFQNKNQKKELRKTVGISVLSLVGMCISFFSLGFAVCNLWWLISILKK